MGNPFGRSNILPLVNKSGGSVAAGDLVYLGDGATADSFTTGTTANRTGSIGIAQQTIASNATGLVLTSGYAALVNVNASVTINHYGASYTVAKQATDVGTSRAAGTCLFFLTGGTTPDAIVWQPDLGGASGMTNPMTTTGDLITSSSGSTPDRIAAVAVGKVLRSKGTGTEPGWDFPPFHGAKAYSDATQTINSGSFTGFTLNQEEFDSDAFHDTVTNNTRMTVPTGMAGKYLLAGGTFASATQWSSIIFRLNGTTNIRGANTGSLNGYRSNSSVVDLAAADYVEMGTTTTASIVFGHASAIEAQTWFTMMLLGT